MTAPRVSIVTTVYDRVHCLKPCLRSVQRLQFRDFEHLVVSDAPSPDVVTQITALCAQYGASYINLPERHNDWGHTPASVGMRASVGDYVCFLSDDNAYLPNHFAPLVAALDEDPDLGFVYSSCLYAGRKELRYCPPVGAGIDLGQPLFRRAVIRECLGDQIPCCGVFSWDWELIRILMHDHGIRWQHVDEATFVFRLAAYPHFLQALA
jgi:glycosyltransferase involved in cell wall biosynthesis